MKQLLAFLASLFGGGKKKKPPVIIVPPVEPTKPPKELNWPDKRAIGMIMLATYKGYTGHENYGNGEQPFDEWLTAFAELCIKNLKYLNAQAAILWDSEGAMFDRPLTYYGDSRLTPVKIDPFFVALSAAGFRTGVCIRPDRIVWTYDTFWKRDLPKHFVVASPLDDMVAKIEHAHKRWGCTVFYVDSNVGMGLTPGAENTIGGGTLIPAAVFAELHKLYPDFLFIPEWYDNEYKQSTLPYYHKGQNPPGDGGRVIDCADTQWSVEQLRDAVKRGNILMSRAWWGPEIELVKQAYNT